MERPARLIRRGDIVQVQAAPNVDETMEEVVRGISVILHLANGQDVHVDSNSKVTVLPPDELPSAAEVEEANRASAPADGGK
jgi:chloramphenicol 3-O-phosphotransferase